jgi:hypothetical protein
MPGLSPEKALKKMKRRDMSEEIMRKALEAQKALRVHGDLLRVMHEQTAPLEDLMRRIAKASEFARLANEWDRNRDLMRAALGPLDDMKRFELAEPSLFAATLRATLDRDLIGRFRLPATIEVAPLLRDFVASGNADTLARLSATQGKLQRAIEAMRTPWLDAQDSIRSIGGFAELQGIGMELQRHPAFDLGFTDNLRMALGDWRAPVTLPASIFDDIGLPAPWPPPFAGLRAPGKRV